MGSGEGLRGAGPPGSGVPRPPMGARDEGEGRRLSSYPGRGTNGPIREPRLSNAMLISGEYQNVEEG